MGDADDIPYGRGIVVALLPFAERLASGTLSPKTARRHIDHLWLLGGEMIRDVNMYDRYAEVTPADLLADSVDPDGGLYCRHLSANERRAYDATCRKLHAFLAAGGTAGARVP